MRVPALIVIVHDRSPRLSAGKGDAGRRRGSVQQLRRGSAQDREEYFGESPDRNDMAMEADTRFAHGTLQHRLSIPI